MSIDFQKTRQELKKIENPNQRLAEALKILFNANGIPDILRVPVFAGYVSQSMKNNPIIRPVYHITNLQTPLKDPYTDGNLVIGVSDKAQGLCYETYVIFTTRIGDLNFENRVLDVCLFKEVDRSIIKKTNQDGIVSLFRELNVEEFFDAMKQEDYIVSYQAYERETIKALENLLIFQKKKQQYDQELENAENNKNTVLKNIEEAQGTLDGINASITDKRLEEDTIKGSITDLRKIEKEISQKVKHARKEMELMVKEMVKTDFKKEHSKTIKDISNESDLEEFEQRMRHGHLTENGKVDDFVRSFLMALFTNQIISICGNPGSGKTTFVLDVADALGAVCHTVAVQNNWTDSSDVLGYYNPINKTYQTTSFYEALLEAFTEEQYAKDNKTLSRLHIVLLDEMNLARIEYYFATFLSQLQLPQKERYISVLPADIEHKLKQMIKEHPEIENKDYSKIDEDDQYLINLLRYQTFNMPSNIRFVGTMNFDDTTNMPSPKVIDRSFYIEYDPVYSAGEREVDDTCYYPASFFTAEPDSSWKESGFDKCNNRFMKYANLMWGGCNKLQCYSEDQFRETLIISKILPSVSRPDFHIEEKYKKAMIRFNKASSGSDSMMNSDQYHFFGE